MKRLRSVLLTLWDLARENPGYDRKLWGELQFHLNDLETRNKILRALMVDLLRSTEPADESLINSPPEGYAVTFLREELARGELPVPQKRSDPPESYNAVDLLMNINPPPPFPTKKSEEGERLSDDLSIDLSELEPSPQTDEERYDGGDESLEDSSDELVFDFDATD